ncbi:MAG: hypothetical protein AB8D78_08135 [Akkermansiaceae bacterium]
MSFRKALIRSFTAVTVVILVSCADSKVDPATPTAAKPKSMVERLSESGGFKQDSEGNWVPKSDKRSAYDSQRDSAYFKGKVEKDTYRTGSYSKKSWWGSKDNYQAGEYQGNTDGSRFQTAARQDGKRARANGQNARLEGPFETNTIDPQRARESRNGRLAKPKNEYTESSRNSYKAPSVIDWKEQRRLSVDQSRGILGR